MVKKLVATVSFYELSTHCFANLEIMTIVV
jgi:hypothetical protein